MNWISIVLMLVAVSCFSDSTRNDNIKKFNAAQICFKEADFKMGLMKSPFSLYSMGSISTHSRFGSEVVCMSFMRQYPRMYSYSPSSTSNGIL